MRTALALLVIVLAACGGSAPAVGESTTDCYEAFCVAVPEGWFFDGDADNVAYSHPDGGMAFISTIDVGYLAESAGADPNGSLADIDAAYWSLLDAISGQLAGQDARVGWAASWGDTTFGRRWHALLSEGVAMTVDLPSSAWDAHGRAWVDGLTNN